MWFTDAQVLSIPSLSALAPEEIPRLAADAGRLYDHIQANPGIDDRDLRAWAEGAGIPPEYYNRASQVLRETGKGVEFPSGPLADVAQPSAPGVPSLASASPGDSVPTDKLTERELRAAAKRLGVDVPKSATKTEAAEAISRL